MIRLNRGLGEGLNMTLRSRGLNQLDIKLFRLHRMRAEPAPVFGDLRITKHSCKCEAN